MVLIDQIDSFRLVPVIPGLCKVWARKRIHVVLEPEDPDPFK